MKNIKLTAIAALFASQAYAGSVQVYGTADVSLQSNGKGNDSYTELKSNASRFGVQGFHKVTDEYVAVFNYEMGIDLSDEQGDKNVTSRNQFVGLSGKFGEVVLGRNDTAMRLVQGNVDLFDNYSADLKNLWSGEVRANNSVTFTSNYFMSSQVLATYVAEEGPHKDAGYSIAIKHGDTLLRGTPFYISAAFDSNIGGYDSTRFTAQTSYNDLVLGFAYHHQEEIASGITKDGFLISGSYPVKGVETKIQFQTLESDSTLTFGSDYFLGDSTKLYSWYSVINSKDMKDNSIFAFGLQHRF